MGNTAKPGGPIQNARELEFAVFCVESVAARLGVSGERVYRAFTQQSDILNGYIVPEYEMLHTQSKDYIVNDILELMRDGVSDLHCMSDDYLADELSAEYQRKNSKRITPNS